MEFFASGVAGAAAVDEEVVQADDEDPMDEESDEVSVGSGMDEDERAEEGMDDDGLAAEVDDEEVGAGLHDCGVLVADDDNEEDAAAVEQGRQVAFIQECVQAYNAEDGALLTTLIANNKNRRVDSDLRLVLFEFGGLVFGVCERLVSCAEVRAGFKEVFAIPIHPGVACPHCGETFYVATIAHNHELCRLNQGVCPAMGDWSEHIGFALFWFDVFCTTSMKL